MNRPQRRTMSQQRGQEMAGTDTSQMSAAIAANSTDFGIWVAIRVRPFNHAELRDVPQGNELPQPIIDVERDGKTVTLLDPVRNFSERAQFQFDYCFSAFRPSIVLDSDKPVMSPSSVMSSSVEDQQQIDEDAMIAEAAQSEVYVSIGAPIVNAAWQGYNSCIFAYGQTSSGKTYTMMGTKRDPGVIPRLSRSLFEKIEEDDLSRVRLDEINAPGEGGPSAGQPQMPPSRKLTKVEVTYMEIYNEKVRDLLRVRKNVARPQFKSRFDNQAADDEYQSLRVRQHPLQGPFVDGIIKQQANSWTDCVKLIRQGSDLRSQCSTEMNDSSSRSHAIFQLIVTQTEHFGAKVRGKEVTNHKVSKINLVDLAGSERITRTNVTGKHITEANYINKSLSTLRKVIDVLVSKKHPGQTVVVPYRESMLTWILADNFGGNSKTAMIATISPHHSNFVETESALRYATLAKGIVNRVRVNEDPSAKLIRELKAQLEQLKSEMSLGPQGDRVRELEDQMSENQRAMEELLAREEGMRLLIHESRKREEQLTHENEDLRRDQERWRDEAERLAKEKEELTLTLRKLAKDGKLSSQLLSSTDNFWADGETSDADHRAKRRNSKVKSTSASAGPPLSQSAAEKPNATNTAPPALAALAPPPEESRDQQLPEMTPDLEEALTATPPPGQAAPAQRPGHSSSEPSNELQEAFNVPSPSRTQPDSSRPTPSVSPSNPRYGRRANTEEGGQRPAIDTSSQPGAMVRTAGEQQRGRRRNNNDDNNVPTSLAHLVGPTTSTANCDDDDLDNTQSSLNKVPAQPQALDSFLSGSPVATGKKDKVPPWRQPKAKRQQLAQESSGTGTDNSFV